jgi:hypothetical protein
MLPANNTHTPATPGQHRHQARSHGGFHLQGMGPAPAAAVRHKAVVEHLFAHVASPHWFGTIQWFPFLRDSINASKEARHFRCKLLCALYNTRPSDIPPLPERPRLLMFHERTYVDTNPYSPKESLGNSGLRLD